MRQKTILYLALSLCCVFVAIQFFLWKFSFRHESEENKQILRRFLNYALNNRFPLFLVDRKVLSLLTNDVFLQTKQCILCNDLHGFITLGTEGHFIDKKAELILKYHEKEHDNVHCEYRKMPWSNLNETVPVNCFLEKNQFVIHVVIFHEVNEEFWWQSSIINRNLITGKFSLGKTDGAFKRIMTRKIRVDGIDLRIPNNPSGFVNDISTSTFYPCNSSRSFLFSKKYRNASTDSNAKYFALKGTNLIRQAKTVLDRLNIPFWLSSGTCLGWFRQCDIIPHSKDVDIGIFIKDYHTALISAMEKEGLQLKHKFGKVSDSLELSFQDGNVKLDIFFFYEEQNYTWNGGTQASSGNKYKYIFPKFSLCWTYFLKMKLRVPCPTLSYIEANYGKNWFVPAEAWDWKSSPPNVKRNGRWPVEEWHEVINVFYS